MKKLFESILLSAAFLLCVDAAFAQATATAIASATIVTPISITKTFDMDFGNIATDGTVGTVVLSPESTRSITGGTTLPATAGTVTAASFDVTGSDLYTYAITLPASVTITSGVNNMTVDTFTSTPLLTGAFTAGAQTLTVGATLNIGASQLAGLYTSATPFTIIVNYN
ncbi:hypothetical protein A0256_01100 [Mucilaginibacter sp. PAMC 26640]|nr:hypothetical protein A0256_01100 [Mucilaginibacter sp. PAMC 26640]